MFDNRWQIKSLDTRTGNELFTTEMPRVEDFGLPGLGYRYESCLFYADGDSDVLARYDTQEEALLGHQRLMRERMEPGAITREGTADDGDGEVDELEHLRGAGLDSREWP